MVKSRAVNMWILALVVVAVLSAWIELPTLWKSKQKKEVIFFSILLFLAIVIGLIEGLHLFDLQLLDWITFLFQPLSNMVSNIVE